MVGVRLFACDTRGGGFRQYLIQIPPQTEFIRAFAIFSGIRVEKDPARRSGVRDFPNRIILAISIWIAFQQHVASLHGCFRKLHLHGSSFCNLLRRKPYRRPGRRMPTDRLHLPGCHGGRLDSRRRLEFSLLRKSADFSCQNVFSRNWKIENDLHGILQRLFAPSRFKIHIAFRPVFVNDGQIQRLADQIRAGVQFQFRIDVAANGHGRRRRRLHFRIPSPAEDGRRQLLPRIQHLVTIDDADVQRRFHKGLHPGGKRSFNSFIKRYFRRNRIFKCEEIQFRVLGNGQFERHLLSLPRSDFFKGVSIDRNRLPAFWKFQANGSRNGDRRHIHHADKQFRLFARPERILSGSGGDIDDRLPFAEQQNAAVARVVRQIQLELQLAIRQNAVDFLDGRRVGSIEPARHRLMEIIQRHGHN